ncbi:MAG: TRAM domain-containing protein [Halobacteriales archaeon]|nr:TRAM domain-containing protein [Halobacteriales archaeon]
MVEVPDSLRSVFSATVQERDGAYVLEVPRGEVDHGAVEPGRTYRVAVLAAASGSTAARDAHSSAGNGRSRGPNGVPEPPVEEGEVRDVTIETLGDQGDGIAKVERGYVVIVPDARPGDNPTVEIEQVRRNVAFASVVDPDSRVP